ncbi:MAG: hypothetical protein HN726_03825 [Candidatus Magasanikbacteria bacterium]|jgi:cytoskeletal protein RodZ|nr:hypothetical protein [Candidatus Magasanikbacteria bacterium]MBT4541921.1 hypothetical protein [Candidatus Magasanikbacteria bacterium]MBT6253052.1 hypothetical protein [Candidatus Magasanikbacteria bacterium]MBT6334575.1 hypothetical protein [Candidatus Magasanikbacteria bacterium]MBT7755301.1 hypothetical protein [Candidatus Magasanikbacteria bacterium]
MSEFQKKQLHKTKRVCLRLKEMRQKEHLSLETIARRTKISKRHLLALEECRFDDIPYAKIYQRNFIKSYIEAIGADPTPYVAQFEEEEQKPKHTLEPQGVKEVRTNHLHQLPTLLRYSTILGVIFIFVLYVGLQVHNILTPPLLTINTPQDGLITSQNTVIINGQTEKNIEVAINGTNIKHNKTGQFEEELTLTPGVNTLIVTAKNKHGKQTQEARYVIFRERPNSPN